MGRLKQRLSTKKRRAPESSKIQTKQKVKRKRILKAHGHVAGAKKAFSRSYCPDDSERAAINIEKNIPLRRERQRRARLEILVQGDLDLADVHFSTGNLDAAKAVMRAMSPETLRIAQTLAAFWIRRANIDDIKNKGQDAVENFCNKAFAATAGEERRQLLQFFDTHMQGRHFKYSAGDGIVLHGSNKKKVDSDTRAQDTQNQDRENELNCSDSLGFGTMLASSDQSPNKPKQLDFDGVLMDDTANSKSAEMSNHMDMVFDDAEENLTIGEIQHNESSSDINCSAEFCRFAKEKAKFTSPGRPAIEVKPETSAEIEGASIVLMSTRRLTGKLAEELGSTAALTPVRRSIRNVLPGSTPQNTAKLLRDVGFAFVPNKSLNGANFSEYVESSEDSD